MRKSLFTVTHHGRSVHGQLFLPDGPGVHPTVLFSHGYNGCMTDFDGNAAWLCQQGIAAISYTFCGGSTRDESGFPTTSMSLLTEKEDLLAVLAWARQQPEIDPTRLFLFGGSQGGLVTVLAAPEVQQDVKGLLLLYPALCIPDNWNPRFPTVEDIPDTLTFWDLTLGRAFFEALRTLDPFALLPDIHLPVLILHGDKDPIVPLHYSQRALQALPRAELTVFPGEGHGFSPEGNRRMEQLIVDFVRRHA